MGTDSCASCGKTCKNHPMAPATLSPSPRMAMAKFVTMPARMSETPSASTRGHAVGRGSWIAAGSGFGCWSCMAVLWLLSAEDVDNGAADERVEGGAEEIGVDGEAVAVDELVPLMRGAAEEDASEQHRRRQPERGCGAPAVVERRDGEVDGGAGGK